MCVRVVTPGPFSCVGVTNLKHITTDEFNSEVLASTTPILVDFYATGCPPCKMLTPILDELAREYGGASSS